MPWETQLVLGSRDDDSERKTFKEGEINMRAKSVSKSIVLMDVLFPSKPVKVKNISFYAKQIHEPLITHAVCYFSNTVK